MNSVNLVGNIGNDLELKQTQSGKSVCSFNLAVKGFGDKTNWLTVVCWGKTAELVCSYQKKGSQIAISGHIDTRSYEDKTGSKRTATEVVADNVFFVGVKSQGQSGASAVNEQTGTQQGDFEEVETDDLPF